MIFDIDPDIRVAKTLPARVYSDPELFHAQRDRVFARTWQYAAHADVVKIAGALHPFMLLPGDEAIVEAVQRGVRSRLYERGRYSATRETGVRHFHRLLAEFLR